MAPGFCLPDQDGKQVCLEYFRGKYVILYFYPKDDTPGCTKEALDFTEKITEFKSLNAVVIGVSPDPIERHRKFIEKHNLKVILLSDVSREVLNMYGVIGLKKRFGKEYYSVIRSTYLIDPEGRIIEVWRNVKVKGHVDNVLNVLRGILGGEASK